jgi:hypothetical protein
VNGVLFDITDKLKSTRIKTQSYGQSQTSETVFTYFELTVITQQLVDHGSASE